MAVASSPAGRTVGAAAVLLVAVGAVTVQLAHDNSFATTYAAARADAAVVQLMASLVLVGAGLVVWFGQDRGSLGPAALGAAVAFLAPVWIGWEGGPEVVRSLGSVVAPLLLALLLDIAVSFPDRRSSGAWQRRLVAAGYAVSTAYVVSRAALYDPFLDPDCWSNCLHSSFLLYPAPGAVRAIDTAWTVVSLLVAAGFVVALVRLGGPTAGPRSLTWPVVVAAAVGGLAQVARVLVSPGPEDPRRGTLQLLFLVVGGSLVALGTALVWSVWRRLGQRVAMSRLAEAAGEAAGIDSLSEALARAAGLPGLELGYWVPATESYVDASGQPLADGLGADVSVMSGDSPVAVIRSGRRDASAVLLADALGPAARLALDNERLRAEEMYHLRQVAESRERIVEASDEARRGLERDLHDGAQQRLLAVMYSLQIAASVERRHGDVARIAALDRAVNECRLALAELRDLAHGIFPAILDAAGLGAALELLGDRATVTLSLEDHTDRFVHPHVAHAAYLVVAQALAAAAEAERPLRVRLDLGGGLLVVTIDGIAPAEYVRTADRVHALGGRLHADNETARVEIPCD